MEAATAWNIIIIILCVQKQTLNYSTYDAIVVLVVVSVDVVVCVLVQS